MRVFVARPRLDCSFKPGPVPAQEGPPKNVVLRNFGLFIDRIVACHNASGDTVSERVRPLWQFDLDFMRDMSTQHDLVYFPHKTKSQFDAGPNVLYYKTSALPDYFTIDPLGWGASLSFLPLPLQANEPSWMLYRRLQSLIGENRSMFDQPALRDPCLPERYLLFLCQLPHDETIQLHSDVSVEDALQIVLAYAEHRGKRLVVKGHPANPRSMLPLKALANQSSQAVWVDDLSIHTCLSGAERVFLVNSGSGFEAMLHDKTIVRFGHAEYDSVVPMAGCSVSALVALEAYRHRQEDYVGFLASFLSRCVQLDTPRSYETAIESALARSRAQ